MTPGVAEAVGTLDSVALAEIEAGPAEITLEVCCWSMAVTEEDDWIVVAFAAGPDDVDGKSATDVLLLPVEVDGDTSGIAIDVAVLSRIVVVPFVDGIGRPVLAAVLLTPEAVGSTDDESSVMLALVRDDVMLLVLSLEVELADVNAGPALMMELADGIPVPDV